MENKFKCCAFDSDGVLTDTANCHFRAWKRLASELGINIPVTLKHELSGISRINALKVILEYGNILSEITSVELANLANQKNLYYQQEISSLTAQSVLPNIFELLDELSAHKIKIIVASGSVNTPRVLKKVGLLSKIDGIVNPKNLPGKPCPDIFVAAAKIANVNPQNCIGVEDSYAGTCAIKKAKMAAVSIGVPATFKGKSDAVIPNTNCLNYRLLNEVINNCNNY